MEIYTIERTDERPLRFEGELLASTDQPNDGITWSELAIYRTKGGRYVCEVRTVWQGEREFIRADVVETEAEVVDFFEPTKIVWELFDSAGIDYAIDVD